MRALAASDPHMAVWWGTEVECASAIARLERLPNGAQVWAALYPRLAQLASTWLEVEPGPELRATAQRLLRVHPLRASDALQLAAAILACGRQPLTLAFVTLDERLARAAEKEGFPLLP